MWMRTHAIHFLRRATTSRPSILNGNHCTTGTVITRHHSYSTGWSSNGDQETVSETSTMTYAEAKKLMRLVNVKELKEKLGLMEGKEVISYDELLRASRSMGVANSVNEAAAFARVLDDAGVVLVFRDKLYLQPDKIVDLVRKAVPLGLLHEDDTCKDELIKLQHEKEEIDVLAHKQVRRILWGGLVLTLSQIGLFFRLTFWEFSWDVMEPVAFFVTASGIVIGYAYFMITSRDPSYQDLLKRLFLSRERKLIQSRGFNIERFLELQKICGSPQDAVSNIKRRTGVDIKPEEILQSR